MRRKTFALEALRKPPPALVTSWAKPPSALRNNQLDEEIFTHEVLSGQMCPSLDLGFDAVVEAAHTNPRHPALKSEQIRGATPVAEIFEVGHSAGQPLDSSVRKSFETSFAQDLSDVRLHTDASADRVAHSIDARAFSTGRHIGFRAGAYEPDEPAGQRLLAHELAHVVESTREPNEGPSTLAPNDDPAERRADEAAERVTRGEQAELSTMTRVQGPVVRRAPLDQPPVPDHVVPSPIQVVWGGDPFMLSFAVEERHHLPSFVVRPRYKGKHKFDAVFLEDFNFYVYIGSAAVNATAQLLPDGRVIIDLYGNSERVYTIYDDWHTRQRFDGAVREHDFNLILLGKVEAISTLWVLDRTAKPDEKAQPIAPPKPFSSTADPTFVAGVAAIDVVLGPYNDHFRLTFMARGNFSEATDRTSVVFGISSLYHGRPNDATSQEFSFVGVPRITVVTAGTGGVTLDLNGDGKADITVSDAITVPTNYDGGGPVETKRNHTVKVSGPEFGSAKFDFTVRWGNTIRGGLAHPTANDTLALNNAKSTQIVGEQIRSNSNFAAILDAYDAALLSSGQKAAVAGVVDASLINAWAVAMRAMGRVRLEASAPPGEVLIAGAEATEKLLALLAAATAKHVELSSGMMAASSRNPYTGESKVYSVLGSQAIAGPEGTIGDALRRNDVPAALSGFQKLSSGVGRWIAMCLTEVQGMGTEASQQAAALAGRRTAMGNLADKHPRVVPAVFFPAGKFSSEPNYIAEIPLFLVAWKEDDEWYLRDLTNPQSTYDFSVEDASSVDPPAKLFSQLDDIDHFPAGIVYFHVSDVHGNGLYGGHVSVRDHLTWKKFFSWLGLGLAALGIGLVTFGTGTAVVVGGYIIAASSIAGGISAGIDLTDKASHNALTPTAVALDLAQIVASIAGVGQLRYGLIVREATTAAELGTPLFGPAAQRALGAQSAYFVNTSVRLAADGVSLIVVGIDTVHELEAIEKSPASREEKDRAKLVLLTTLAINGGMYALTVKGELPALGAQRKLVLHHPVKGGPPAAYVGGLESPTGLKFSQNDVSGLTGDGTMTIEELAESMKRGWKGDPIDVVEMPDGTKMSLDNRRLLAAQMAGLKEIPVAYHPPGESFPIERNPVDPKTGKQAFELSKSIRRLNGKLVVGGDKGEIVYHKGTQPQTYGEAAMFRSANQDNGKFGLEGSFEKPKIRRPKN